MHPELATFARTCLAHFAELQLEETQAKDRQDYVTNVDLALDRFIGDWIRKTYAGAHVVSEEAPESWDLSGDDVWVVDPLDGTLNFMAGLPHYAVSVARLHRGETVAACVANLANGDIYTGVKGGGAYLNDKPLKAKRPAAELVGISTGANERALSDPELFNLLRQSGKLRNIGSQALHLCYAAQGLFALTASTEARFWDDAAGALIASEAGVCYQPIGNPTHDGLSTAMGSLCGDAKMVAKVAPYFARQQETSA